MSADHSSPWLKRFAALIPKGGTVLDLASGSGRNCTVLLEHGHRVLAVDRDPELLQRARALGADILCLDLEVEHLVWPFESQQFAGIVVCNYLHRPLFARLIASLAPEGVLILETFGQGNEQIGRPTNPNFLLAPGELLGLTELANDLHVVAYENGYVETPKPAIVQRICIKKSQRPAAREISLENH